MMYLLLLFLFSIVLHIFDNSRIRFISIMAIMLVSSFHFYVQESSGLFWGGLIDFLIILYILAMFLVSEDKKKSVNKISAIYVVIVLFFLLGMANYFEKINFFLKRNSTLELSEYIIFMLVALFVLGEGALRFYNSKLSRGQHE